MIHLRLKPLYVTIQMKTIKQYFYVYGGRCLPYIFFVVLIFSKSKIKINYLNMNGKHRPPYTCLFSSTRQITRNQILTQLWWLDLTHQQLPLISRTTLARRLEDAAVNFFFFCDGWQQVLLVMLMGRGRGRGGEGEVCRSEEGSHCMS